MGDLTLYQFAFTTIATTDAYSVTNFVGAVGAWISPWCGVTTFNSVDVSYTNSSTGLSLSFIGASASTATVYVLGGG